MPFIKNTIAILSGVLILFAIATGDFSAGTLLTIVASFLALQWAVK